MAVLAAAQLLDELMGRNRNVLPHEKVKELNWEDPEYCKYFMVKFCPHDLFVNTKADLGSCPKVHDEEVRKIFAKAKGHRKVLYQEEFLRCCSQMVNEVERKIQKGRQRLSLIGKQEMTPANPAQFQRNEEQIALLNERINGLEKEAEEAGNNGNVEQAQGLMKLCDQLKEERDQLKKQNDNGHRSVTAELAAAQEKQMEVCEVCGAFLIVGDAQQRIDDHLMGKQHMGYARLKAAIEEVATALQISRDERKIKSDAKKDKEKDVEKEREKSDPRKSSSKERERSHREHRDRSEHRSDKDRSVSERREVDKDRKDRERPNSDERRNSHERRNSADRRNSDDRRTRDRVEREKPQRDNRERDRRYQNAAGHDSRSHRHSYRRH